MPKVLLYITARFTWIFIFFGTDFYENRVSNKLKVIFDKKFRSKKFKSDLKFLYDVIFEKI